MTTNYNKIIRSLPPRQRAALDQIGAGNYSGQDGEQSLCQHKRTLKALANKGLIELHIGVLPGRLPVQVLMGEMPIPVHMAWCAVCAEECGDCDDIEVG